MKTRRAISHTFVWLVYITVEFLTLYTVGMKSDAVYAVLYYPLFISIFYFHATFLLNIIEQKRYQWLIGGCLITIEIVIACSLCLLIRGLIGIAFLGQSLSQLNKYDVAASAWRTVSFLMFSTGYWFALRSVRLIKQNSLLKLSQLQSQLKPHLVVNTLNFVYSTIVGVSKEGSNAVLLLSDVMRYSYKETEPDGKTGITGELAQIRKLIEINQIRFDDKLELELYISEQWPEAWRIPPSLLLTFIGNVFQHGQMLNKEYPARVILRSEDNKLSLYTFNLKSKKDSTGSQTGVRNAVTQLKMFYPYSHQLSIHDLPGQYTLSLNIWL